MQPSQELQNLQKKLKFAIAHGGQSLDRLEREMGGRNSVVSLVCAMTPEHEITKEKVSKLCTLLGLNFDNLPQLSSWESTSA